MTINSNQRSHDERQQGSPHEGAEQDRLSSGLRLGGTSNRGGRRSRAFDYRGQHHANVLYVSAEILTLRSLAILFNVETARDALDVLAEDVLRVIAWTYAACQGYHDWFLQEHIFPHHPLERGQMIDVPAPSFESVIAPFFTDMDGMANRLREVASDGD